MLTIKGIIGLPVLINGEKAGHILGIRMDDALLRIEAIYVIRRSMCVRKIEREALIQMGTRAISAASSGIPARERAEPLFRRAVSTDGKRLGAIVDAEFDDSLNIAALWLSCGYPDDLLTGRRRIAKYSVRKTDGCVLIPSGEEDCNEQRHDQGNGGRRTAGRDGSDCIRRDELGEGTPVEKSGGADGPNRAG